MDSRSIRNLSEWIGWHTSCSILEGTIRGIERISVEEGGDEIMWTEADI